MDEYLQNPRSICKELLSNIIEECGPVALNEVCEGVKSTLVSCESDTSGDWRLKEAAWLAIGCLSGCMESKKKRVLVMKSLNLKDFLEFLISFIMTPGTHEGDVYLISRAFATSSAFANFLEMDQVVAILQSCINGIGPQSPVQLRLSACIALEIFNSCVPDNFMKQLPVHSFSLALDGMVGLVPLTDGDSAHIVLESIHTIIKTNLEAATPVIEKLSACLFDLWKRFPTDPLICPVACSALSKLVKAEECRHVVLPVLLPIISQVLMNPVDIQSEVVESSLDFLRLCVVEGAGEGILDMLNAVLTIGSKTMDDIHLQSSVDTLSAFAKHATNFVRASIQGNVPTVNTIVDIILRSLDPEKSDSACMYTGNLIFVLLQNMSEDLPSEVVKTLIERSVVRVASTKSAGVVCQFCFLFARLMLSMGVEEVVAMLGGFEFAGNNGLAVILSKWCTYQEFFAGPIQVKATLVAMTQLMKVPSLDDITVRCRNEDTEPFKVAAFRCVVGALDVEECFDESGSDTDDFDDYQFDEDDDQYFACAADSREFAPAEEYFSTADMLDNDFGFDDDEDDCDDIEDLIPDLKIQDELKGFVQDLAQSQHFAFYFDQLPDLEKHACEQFSE
eukprot:TRINITY_DN692_c0_g1_i2.p1 TRINITY_DN692_c0_g1~~TRINITY_DN692_c0_g1_i2.p1  ORF type:complete len:727 (+),score=175.97 TRINITY_DN692_c0_g1_i2:325-2181(+)